MVIQKSYVLLIDSSDNNCSSVEIHDPHSVCLFFSDLSPTGFVLLSYPLKTIAGILFLPESQECAPFRVCAHWFN